ncbi:MAG: J domain-containing protein [Rhodospirillales bacterium]|nr:J domain-containing protein [Rhodospirillales bacterium]
MSDLYRVLGLSTHADQQQIKIAYRDLAKRSHPDVNAGDKAAEQRIRDINRAYEVLGDVEARAAYDSELACRRAEVRRRLWRLAATAGATFVVTVFVSMVALWRQDLLEAPAERRPTVASLSRGATSANSSAQKSAASGVDERPAASSADNGTTQDVPIINDPTWSDAAMAGPSALQDTSPGLIEPGALPPGRELDASALAQQAPPSPEMASKHLPGRSGAELREQVEQLVPQEEQPFAVAIAPVAAPPSVTTPSGWTTYRDARFDFGVSYPAEVFALAKSEIGEDAYTRVSRDGRAVFRIWAAPNTGSLAVADYRRTLIETRYANATFDYTPRRNFWFVLSGIRGDEMFYERVTMSCDRKSMHAWQLRYPVAERAFYDPIVEAVHRKYRHGNGPGAQCRKA